MALLDTLMRRGVEDAEAELETAFYSSMANEERVAAYRERVGHINALEDDIEELSDEALATLAAVLMLCEGRCEWGTELIVLIVLLLKADGGLWPIGLLPTIIRVWGACAA